MKSITLALDDNTFNEMEQILLKNDPGHYRDNSSDEEWNGYVILSYIYTKPYLKEYKTLETAYFAMIKDMGR